MGFGPEHRCQFVAFAFGVDDLGDLADVGEDGLEVSERPVRASVSCSRDIWKLKSLTGKGGRHVVLNQAAG